MGYKNRLDKWSWRVYPLWLMLLIALLALIFRLAQLQLFDAEKGRIFLQQQGDARVIRNELIPVSRAEIVDRNGYLLAFSSPVKTVWANPKLIVRDEIELDELASSLGLSLDALKEKLSTKSSFVYLRRQMDPQQAELIAAKKYAGIFFKTEYKRFYPAGEVTSHLVGFTDIDERGQEGIELSYDEILRSRSGLKQVMRNARHENIKNIKQLSPASAGQQIALSIDMRLQYVAYRELKSAVANHQASSGSIVILDTNTGEVLALANQPSYNANDRQQFIPEHMRNRGIIDLYEPGSVVKPFTVMAALESGDFDLTSTIDTSPGTIYLNGNLVSDQKDYGKIDLATILSKSSNVGTSKIAISLGEDQLLNLFAKLGLGQHSASGFPGEQSGHLPRYIDDELFKATLSFGHGLTVNSIQLARAYAVIANHGVKQPISLLKLGPQNVVSDAHIIDVVSSATADKVLTLMQGVTELGGTGMQAAIKGYSVAGKTGTTHKVGQQGYEGSRYRASFAGIVPASSPRLVAVITIDDPVGNKYFGGDVAAPIFSRVMASALRLLNIPPDQASELDASEFTTASQRLFDKKLVDDKPDNVRDKHGSV